MTISLVDILFEFPECDIQPLACLYIRNIWNKNSDSLMAMQSIVIFSCMYLNAYFFLFFPFFLRMICHKRTNYVV